MSPQNNNTTDHTRNDGWERTGSAALLGARLPRPYRRVPTTFLETRKTTYVDVDPIRVHIPWERRSVVR